MTLQRPIALITGAYGGMGRACARQLGRRCDLVLTDRESTGLETLAETLRDEGHTVAAVAAGDLSAPGVAQTVVLTARQAGRLGVVAHTAGLSPALAGWEAILQINLAGTERLLIALEAELEAGLAAVLLASMAGHMAPTSADIDSVLAEPLDDRFLTRMQPLLQALVDPADRHGLASPAYGLSKRAVIRLCERRGPAWGAKGARIVSISPGLIWTPMGRKEAEANPAVVDLLQATPIARWGTVLDIANVIEFLSSDLASYITGCDLRVDGGVTPALLGVTF